MNNGQCDFFFCDVLDVQNQIMIYDFLTFVLPTLWLSVRLPFSLVGVWKKFQILVMLPAEHIPTIGVPFLHTPISLGFSEHHVETAGSDILWNFEEL